MNRVYILLFLIFVTLISGLILTYYSPYLVENMYCPTFVQDGLLTEEEVLKAKQKPSFKDDSDGLGVSINLRVRRAEPTGKALLSKQAITEL